MPVLRPVPTVVLALCLLVPMSLAQEGDRAYLGISVRDDHSAARGRGVLITRVVDDSAAERAGLEPGQIILSCERAPTPTAQHLIDAIREHRGEGRVDLAILAEGREFVEVVDLEPRPQGASPLPDAVQFPDPLSREEVEKRYRRAERAYLSGDFESLGPESIALRAYVSLFLSTGLDGLHESDRETFVAEVVQHRERVNWFGQLAEAGIRVPINRLDDTNDPDQDPEERIARLIEQLGSPEFVSREAATRALEAIGEAARPHLEAAASGTDLEVQWRARMILSHLTATSGPSARPKFDYRPVLLEVVAIEDDTLHFESQLGRPLPTDRAVRAIVLQEHTDRGEVWLADFEAQRCLIRRHTDEDPVPHPGDRLLWFYKIGQGG